MTVTWEELGWERVAPGVGRVRLPGWDCTAGLVAGRDGALLIDAGSSLAEGRGCGPRPSGSPGAV